MGDYKTNGIRNLDRIKFYRKSGVALFMLIAITLFFKEKIMPLLKDGLLQFEWYQWLLLVSTVVLAAHWIWSINVELDDVLCKWIDSSCYAAPSHIVDFAVFSAFAIFLGSLFFCVDNIVYYCGLYAIYACSDIYLGGFHLLGQMADMIYRSEQKLKEYKDTMPENEPLSKLRACEMALNAIKSYYIKNIRVSVDSDDHANPDESGYEVTIVKKDLLKNHYFRRILLIAIGSLIVFGISFLSKITAYILISLLIIVGEIAIDMWRLERDRILRKAHRIWSPDDK